MGRISLTLTLVVFELVKLKCVIMCFVCLTLTLVVFESAGLKLLIVLLAVFNLNIGCI